MPTLSEITQGATTGKTTLNSLSTNQNTPNKTPAQTQNDTANEKRGFFGNILPVGGSILGGILGTLGGALIPGADVSGVPEVAGGIAGAGIGGGIGEAAQQGIENLMGTRKGVNVPQVGTTAAWSSVAQGAGEAIAPIAKTLVGGVEMLGNIPKGQLLDVLSNPKDYVPGFKGGVEYLQNVVKTVGDNLGKASGALTDEISKLIAPIADHTIQGGQAVVDTLKQSVGKLMGNIDVNPVSGQFSKFGNIPGVIMPKTLDFTDSPIVNQGEKASIQKVYDVVNKLNENSTVNDVNKVVRTVGAVWNDMKDSTGKKIVGTILNSVHDFINVATPELAQVRDAIQPKEVFLDTMRNIIPQQTGKSMNGQTLDEGVQKLLGLIGKSGSAEAQAVEKFAQDTGTNIMKDAAGVKIANPTLTGMGKMQPGSTSQLMSKVARTGWGWLEQLPIKMADQTDFISRMVKTGIPEQTVKTVLQALTLGKKQGK